MNKNLFIFAGLVALSNVAQIQSMDLRKRKAQEELSELRKSIGEDRELAQKIYPPLLTIAVATGTIGCLLNNSCCFATCFVATCIGGCAYGTKKAFDGEITRSNAKVNPEDQKNK